MENADWRDIHIELLNEANTEELKRIHREDVSEAFVDSVETIAEITQYGIDHHCIGHTYAIKYKESYIGLILLGEALEWETDPAEMKGTPFYRLMGFVIDRRYRNGGIGSYVLEKVIRECYQEFGIRPIALGCHRDNRQAAAFYERHGFVRTQAMEGDDYYYLRYQEQT
ncbi:MAG: GNAT family N-acetyltransferase [Lachnospiraceae bacterium]|nr:GNAT family N-acetyltransferase [uncultured Acetatifactor sp.]MCI8696572.1 GNAT family N-acetyltransferase [Lachnospiraceae bacterium]MCI9571075.1 GNAT family N-acetyltransferase [Lachnospiraceae bacterium]